MATPIFSHALDFIYLVVWGLILIGNLIGPRDTKGISKEHFWVWLWGKRGDTPCSRHHHPLGGISWWIKAGVGLEWGEETCRWIPAFCSLYFLAALKHSGPPYQVLPAWFHLSRGLRAMGPWTGSSEFVDQNNYFILWIHGPKQLFHPLLTSSVILWKRYKANKSTLGPTLHWENWNSRDPKLRGMPVPWSQKWQEAGKS